MFIATQKKKENIAEYVLYMWQIEDIIRAYKLDIDTIKATIIAAFKLPEEQEKELVEWYEHLIDMMRYENVVEKGHLQINKNTLINLTDLHKQLIFSQDHLDYSSSFYKALPFLTELRVKQNLEEEQSDIEVAFTFLYGILMLKLQRKEITPETQKAQDIISKLVAVLSVKYKLQQEGKLKLDLD